MKRLIIFPLAMLCSLALGQISVNKVVSIKSGQEINMKFDYPDLIKVSTWDKNEISIGGTVEINFGENDDAFELDVTESGGTVYIENHIRNLMNLPQRITIVDKGQRMVFKSKTELNKYKEENPGSYDRMSWGPNIDITLEIKVPKNVKTTVISVYGVVEVKDFSGPLSVDAKYGAVDAALNEKAVGELVAETNYGQIYSNLDVDFKSDGMKERDFYTYVTAKPGAGPKYDFESQFGNVYLRKSN